MHGEMINTYKISVGKLKERGKLEDLGVEGKIILEWILGNLVEKDWMHLGQDREH
jgi:hypothetical protein